MRNKFLISAQSMTCDCFEIKTGYVKLSNMSEYIFFNYNCTVTGLNSEVSVVCRVRSSGLV